MRQAKDWVTWTQHHLLLTRSILQPDSSIRFLLPEGGDSPAFQGSASNAQAIEKEEKVRPAIHPLFALLVVPPNSGGIQIPIAYSPDSQTPDKGRQKRSY